MRIDSGSRVLFRATTVVVAAVALLLASTASSTGDPISSTGTWSQTSCSFSGYHYSDFSLKSSWAATNRNNTNCTRTRVQLKFQRYSTLWVDETVWVTGPPNGNVTVLGPQGDSQAVASRHRAQDLLSNWSTSRLPHAW